MTETIQHPYIGPIVGKIADGIVQFLGIKYATLTDRLGEPQLLSKYDGHEIDATKTGYYYDSKFYIYLSLSSLLIDPVRR